MRTGLLLPITALRSDSSAGSGDFLDLIELGDWCVEAGFDLIQLLPVNDSGTHSSPYSALSAYALHPLLIRITAVMEYDTATDAVRKRIEPLEQSLRGLEEGQRLNYAEVLRLKVTILKELFVAGFSRTVGDEDFLLWMQENAWVREYAVFRSIKEENESRSWLAWRAYSDPSAQDIENLWEEKKYSNLFYAWLQYRLEEQFLQAVRSLKQLGIVLKGDIPILMSDDSVAVWAHRDIFCLDFCAGAPPDMFAVQGQNWGFPTYNWDCLEQRNYDWWELRLRQAGKFYGAYRIDHVLGFFRIWTIPHAQREAILGYFSPSCYIHRHELYEIGFNDERIHWLSEPHIPLHWLQEAFAEQTREIISCCLTKIGSEELYLFNADIRGEQDIFAMPLDDWVKEDLLAIYRDRSLIQITADEFAEAWHFRSCSRYQQLFDGEKHAFEGLVNHKTQGRERLWAERGERFLSFINNTIDMRSCAEDLGAVPACVPQVLEKLGIPGLKIPRWEREWRETAQPFRPPAEYPACSVCAPSVHDSSTLREWWEYEDGREGFWQSLGLTAPCPAEYSTQTAETVFRGLLNTSSTIIVFQIQDIFALANEYRIADSRDERINIPGTVQDRNWSYRIPMKIDDLKQNLTFTAKLRALVGQRKVGPC